MSGFMCESSFNYRSRKGEGGRGQGDGERGSSKGCIKQLKLGSTEMKCRAHFFLFLPRNCFCYQG